MNSHRHVHGTLRRISLWLAVAALGELFAADGIKVERVLGPEVKTGDYKHPACFDELRNGDLYLVFFSGHGEYNDNSAAVFGARLRRDGSRWSSPEAIARDPFRSLGNPVIWQAPDGPVWLFYVSRYGTHWSDSRIAGKVSRDGARSWSDSFMVACDDGMMVRGHPIVLHKGDYLLPIYHEVGRDTEKVDANCTSLFLRFDPATKLWQPGERVRSRLGNIQPAAVEVAPNHLLAFCRRGGDYAGRPDGWLVRTESRDGGRTWSEGCDSEFPNPNAAVDFIKLRNGHLLLVFNDSFTNRTPLTVAISTDNAKTFPYRRNIAEGPGDFGYPTAVQTRDEKIHVVYTSDERTVVRHAVFAETAILSRNDAIRSAPHLDLSPLRAGRGELERTPLGSLFGDPETVPPKVSLSLSERERVTCLPRRLRRRQGVRVRLDCMDTAETPINMTNRTVETDWSL